MNSPGTGCRLHWVPFVLGAVCVRVKRTGRERYEPLLSAAGLQNVGNCLSTSVLSRERRRCRENNFGARAKIHRLPVCTACCCCLHVRIDVSAEVRATLPAQAYLPVPAVSAIFWPYS